jgi:hypothetical protein
VNERIERTPPDDAAIPVLDVTDRINRLTRRLAMSERVLTDSGATTPPAGMLPAQPAAPRPGRPEQPEGSRLAPAAVEEIRAALLPVLRRHPNLLIVVLPSADPPSALSSGMRLRYDARSGEALVDNLDPSGNGQPADALPGAPPADSLVARQLADLLRRGDRTGPG